MRPRLLAPLLLAACSATAAHALQTGEIPQAIAVADFDRNGLPDLAVAHAFDDRVVLLPATGPGVWAPGQSLLVGASPSHPLNAPRHLVARDWNGDGWADVTVLCSGNEAFGVGPSLHTWINRGDGSLAPLTAQPLGDAAAFPVQFAVLTLGAPGRVALAVAEARGGRVRLMEAAGAGWFSDLTSWAAGGVNNGPEFVLAADVDGDGLDDVVSAGAGGVHLARQSAAGVFAAPVAVAMPPGGGGSRALLWEDWTGDGRGDLLVAESAGRVVVLSGLGADGSAAAAEELTHASLNGPIDLAALADATGMARRVAVANLGADTVTIFERGGAVEVLAVPAEPRRLAPLGGGAGLGPALAVAAQGDRLNPAQEDVVVLPGRVIAGATVIALGTAESIGNPLGTTLPGAVGMAAANGSTLWVLEADRRWIREMNPSPALNANPRARGGTRIDLGLVAGALVFSNASEFAVVERHAPVIHRRRTNGQVLGTVSIPEAPGPLGFNGLALESGSGDYFVADTSNNRILRVSPAGALVVTITTQRPPWALEWNRSQSRLYAFDPMVAGADRYTGAGVADTPWALAGAGTWLSAAGIVGAFTPQGLGGDRVYLDSRGVLVLANNAGVVQSITTVAGDGSALGVVVDTTAGVIHVLGRDGHLVQNPWPAGAEGRQVSLLPALLGTDFLPGGLARDPATGDLLVVDTAAPRVARWSTAGNFLGFESSPAPASVHPTGGLVVAADGTRHWRGGFGAWSTADLALTPLPPGSQASLAMSAERLLAAGALPGEVWSLATGAKAGPERLATNPPTPATWGAGAEGQLLLFSAGAAPTVAVLALPPNNPSRVDDWMAY